MSKRPNQRPNRRTPPPIDARARAAAEARRILGTAAGSTRQNPATARAAVDPDLANLASDIEHGYLLSSPD